MTGQLVETGTREMLVVSGRCEGCWEEAPSGRCTENRLDPVPGLLFMTGESCGGELKSGELLLVGSRSEESVSSKSDVSECICALSALSLSTNSASLSLSSFSSSTTREGLLPLLNCSCICLISSSCMRVLLITSCNARNSLEGLGGPGLSAIFFLARRNRSKQLLTTAMARNFST